MIKSWCFERGFANFWYRGMTIRPSIMSLTSAHGEYTLLRSVEVKSMCTNGGAVRRGNPGGKFKPNSFFTALNNTFTVRKSTRSGSTFKSQRSPCAHDKRESGSPMWRRFHFWQSSKGPGALLAMLGGAFSVPAGRRRVFSNLSPPELMTTRESGSLMWRRCQFWQFKQRTGCCC